MEMKNMICPKCGRKSEGKYCSWCGALLEKAAPGKTDDFSGIDFVPEDDWGGLEEEDGIWQDAGQDLDETVVLEPLDTYEPGEKRNLYRGETASGTPGALRPGMRNGQESGSRAPAGSRGTGRKASGYEEPEDAGEWQDTGRKFSKYGRDPYDIPESGEKRRRTVYEEQVVTSRKTKKKGKAASAARSVGRTAGKTVGKTVGLAGHGIGLVLRIACLLLLAVTVLRLGFAFWGQRETLGALSQVVAERNFAQALYVILAVCTVAYGLLSLLWLFSRRRMVSEGKLRKFDTGRGLAAFVVYFVLAFAASRTVLYLPEAPSVLGGLELYFRVFVSCQGTVYICCAAGIICCVIRKILKT